MLSSLSLEDLIPADHPIRRIRKVVDVVLVEMDGEFDAMYARSGRPSVPPETLLKATVLMALYSIRSERAFCERVNYDLLFKWFLDLAIDARAFDATTFTENRDRLLDLRSRSGSSPRWSLRRSCAGIARASISPSTGRCWRRGRRTRASNPKTPRDASRRRRVATPRSVSMANADRTTRTNRQRIPRRGWPASPTPRPRSSVIQGIC